MTLGPCAGYNFVSKTQQKLEDCLPSLSLIGFCFTRSQGLGHLGPTVKLSLGLQVSFVALTTGGRRPSDPASGLPLASALVE
jgi:hypothetical protein